MSLKYIYDAVIIGSGPGGQGASIELTRHGAFVAIIESYHKVGGGCTHTGTIPSKSLIQAVEYYSNIKNIKYYKDNYIKLTDIIEYTNKVIYKQAETRKNIYKNNKCKIYFGEAQIIDHSRVKVFCANKKIKILNTKNIILACGSISYRPKNIDFTHPNIFDSDSILNLKNNPNHIIIYGAGVIGCEYASIFRRIKIKVDLINTKNSLLSFLDQETSKSLYNFFSNIGINIINNEEYLYIHGMNDGVEIKLSSGKHIKADCLFYSNGRIGNITALKLEKIGLKTNKRGLIKVNKLYQTDIDNIYAVGDIVGYPNLASSAYDQGRIAAINIATSGQYKTKYIQKKYYLKKNIPIGIFTIPEIGAIGKTEQDLINMNIPYIVGYAPFSEIARAQIIGKSIGHLKILFHRYTKRILGVHCFGEKATELIHMGQIIIDQKGKNNSIEYFANTTFNYPTMAEAYKIAALNGLNNML